MSMKMNPEISVIILCYKSQDRAYNLARKVVSLLEDYAVPYEIILVGNYIDGDADNTPFIVKHIAAEMKNVRAVTLPKQGMMGWDARQGMEAAEGNHICLIDGDEQTPLFDIIRVYEKLKNDHLDFVQTYRISRSDGFQRKILSNIYNMIFRLLFPHTGLRDINSKPKMITRKAYQNMNLTSNDWFLDAEMAIQARRLNLKTGEIPTTFYRCTYRKSFVNFTTIPEFVKNLILAKLKDLEK